MRTEPGEVPAADGRRLELRPERANTPRDRTLVRKLQDLEVRPVGSRQYRRRHRRLCAECWRRGLLVVVDAQGNEVRGE